MSTLQTVIIVIHLVLVLALIAVVLLQRSEGGLGLGGGGGGVSGFMTGRGSANALTRTTAFLAAGFFATSLALSMIASHGSSGPRSILDSGATEAPVSGSENVLQQLQDMQGGEAAPSSGQPAAPAPAAPENPQVPRSQ